MRAPARPEGRKASQSRRIIGLPVWDLYPVGDPEVTGRFVSNPGELLDNAA